LNTTILIVMRLLCAIIFAVWSGYLCYLKLDGWGWMMVASIFLGGITISKKGDIAD
jgi:hypothetical protein